MIRTAAPSLPASHVPIVSTRGCEHTPFRRERPEQSSRSVARLSDSYRITTAQIPFVQGTPPQQSLAEVHIWPYSAHAPPAPPAPVAPPYPPVPGGVLQVPFVEPSGWTHVEAAQQSPLMLQEPPAGTQLSP
jgi:hypothetical protein